MSEREQFEGKTLSDAIERASMKYNATRDRIEYRIIKESQGGFFGLLGGKIIIEAWVRGPISDAEVEEKYGIDLPEKKPAATRGGRQGAVAPPDREPPPDGSRPEGADGRKRRRRRGRRGKGEPGTAGQQPRQTGGPGAGQAPAQGRPPRPEGEREPREPREQADSRPVAGEPVTVGPEVEAFLGGLFLRLGEELNLALEEDAQHLLVKITVAPESIFSSREGHTIESLKFLLDKTVNKGPVIRKRVKVHVSERSTPGQDEWAGLGAELGRAALAINKPIAVRGIQAQDRKAIHAALLGVHGVETVSSGDGVFRKLYVVPRGARPAPQKPPADDLDGLGETPDDNIGNR